MVRMLAWLPSIVVVRAGSEEITSPLRLHVSDTGLSPFFTKQVIIAVSPSLTASSPNVNGTISGASVK
jgi:hypothetical protein